MQRIGLSKKWCKDTEKLPEDPKRCAAGIAR
jgi:hypothetical protein